MARCRRKVGRRLGWVCRGGEVGDVGVAARVGLVVPEMVARVGGTSDIEDGGSSGGGYQDRSSTVIGVDEDGGVVGARGRGERRSPPPPPHADDDCTYGDTDGDDGLYDEYEEEGLEEVDDEGGILDEMHFKATQYAVLTMDELRAWQEEHTTRVADLIALPPALAAAVLRHFKWSAQGVWERWFSDEHKVRDAVGLPEDGNVLSMAVNDATLTATSS
ncbi:hypothetical protein ZWY2020_011009 [Hordeum vulgare]|nr:hypothetical protein ZWY2020_011009 [Hordeum vulgare]